MNKAQLLNAIYFFVALTFSPQVSWAQVLISGVVSHADEALEGATIKWVEDGNVVKTYLTDRKGRFEIQSGFNEQFTLVFVRPFMFPVAIDVDTRTSGEDLIDLYEVPLLMTMHYRFAGMSESQVRRSIGKISLTGSGKESFSFSAYPEALAALKKLAEESTQREAHGELAVESEVFETEVPTAPLTKSVPSEMAVEGSQAKVKPEMNNASTRQSNDKPVDKRDLAVHRNAEVAKAREMERELQIDNSATIAASDAAKEQLSNDYAFVAKQIRSDYLIYQNAAKETTTENRLNKSVSLVAALKESASFQEAPVGKSPSLIKFTVEDGLLTYREEILLSNGQGRALYAKEVYHWLFFDVAYFYKGKTEISEQDYVSIKQSVGL